MVMHTLPTHVPVPDHHCAPGTGRRHDHQPAREDKPFRSRTELYEDIVALLGPVRQALVLGDISCWT